jgi:hypothetical protein
LALAEVFSHFLVGKTCRIVIAWLAVAIIRTAMATIVSGTLTLKGH